MAAALGRWLSHEPVFFTSAYNYRINQPTRTVIPTSAQRVFHVVLGRDRGPKATSSCGGAEWIINWSLLDQNNQRPEEDLELCGFFIQHVTITSCIIQCPVPNPAECLPEQQVGIPRSFEYWEAWAFRNKATPTSVPINLTDDTLKYAGYGSSTGDWSINGDAVFMDVPCDRVLTLPPLTRGRWLTRNQCNRLKPRWTINLPCAQTPPLGFDKVEERIKRKLSFGWDCDCANQCVCLSCTGSLSVGKGAIAPSVRPCARQQTNCP
jgi:hypothetical protein